MSEIYHEGRVSWWGTGRALCGKKFPKVVRGKGKAQPCPKCKKIIKKQRKG
jgi:hypothetical protein